MCANIGPRRAPEHLFALTRVIGLSLFSIMIKPDAATSLPTLPIAVLTALRASIRIFPLASGEVNNVGPFIIRPEHAQ
jgi:hypothetical protein